MSYNTILATAPLTTQNYHLKMIGTSIGNSLIWDNGTNVGIGNTNTSYTLDVSGTGRFTSTLLVGGAATFSGFVGINGSPATSFPLEAYINSSTAYSSTSRGNVMRVYNSNTSANIFAGIELGGAGTANDGLAGLNAVVTGSGSAALTFYTRDSNTFAERMRITSAGNVGIGTTAPNGKLDVKGNAAGTTSLQLDWGGATYGNFIQSYGGGSYDRLSLIGNDIIFAGSGPTERMRLASNGGLVIGDTSITGTTKLKAISGGAVNGNPLMFVDNGIYNAIGLYSAGADGYSGAVCVMIMGRNTTNNRSINAGGTINASGNDYAEYMTKAIEDNIAKGDVVGVNANGLLTNIFADAKSFVVKSTDPSYVGGDTWGNVDIIGKLPLEATDEEKAEYEAKIELARAKVDRVAFSGQVPCNVLGANVGDYIIPINDNGTIKGQAVTNPTFEQYQLSVGKVWKIMEDGRAWIAVKIG